MISRLIAYIQQNAVLAHHVATCYLDQQWPFVVLLEISQKRSGTGVNVRTGG